MAVKTIYVDRDRTRQNGVCDVSDGPRGAEARAGRVSSPARHPTLPHLAPCDSNRHLTTQQTLPNSPGSSPRISAPTKNANFFFCLVIFSYFYACVPHTRSAMYLYVLEKYSQQHTMFQVAQGGKFRKCHVSLARLIHGTLIFIFYAQN